MSKKMLIDASHPEETRVAVMQNGKVEDFDFESLSRKPLRGNIYLARITRVEPSLQAAFVEYGGNRHGFLAFNEIHPDYYQIPVSDREVLRKAEALEAELAEALAAYETDEDVEPDLDEEDDGLRAVDAEVPDEDALEAEASEDEADDTVRDEEPEEEEEEEEEPEDGGSAEERKPDEPEAGDPADYAGEGGAEEPGWHAVEEEEIAALPPREDVQTAQADADDGNEDDEEGDRAAGNAQPTESGAEGPLPAAAAKAAADSAEKTEAETEAGDAEDSANADGSDDDERKAKPRRRRRRGGRGRRKQTASSDDADETDDDGGQARDDESKADAQEADDDADSDETPKSGRRNGKGKSSDPRAKEIAELERRYEEAKRERAKLLKNYRIQEVIKRRQIMLVQAVKEERGNKGAALTTYLSLAGRYGVLMPNTARGGGVSRKITNSSDRKRLRAAMSELEIPQGMGLIIRTAGAKRTKAEIKRDYDYLSRLWETIRDDTMKSVAPCMIYEEASLIKRAIRDLYDKDTDQVLVQGEEGYREAKDFMKMLMPSHAKNVQPYREAVPLFLKHHVERQIDEMYQPTVKLPAGGYLVIQQTEALVSVDVNSGKSTKERNVEQTALKTNLEAAKEVARQCKLRDLAGLVVIDFIDMDERKNNRAVEKALKDAMKTDRARIQLGSISDFGLLEFSRQRKRSGIVDGTTRLCPLCEGAGHVRSVEMAAMRILRSVEEEALKGKAGLIKVQTAMDVALYTLNTKRDWLNRIEATYGTTVEVLGDPHKNGDQYELSVSGEPRPTQSLRQDARAELASLDDDGETDADAGLDEEKPSKRRSRGGRGRSGSRQAEQEQRTVDAEPGERDEASDDSAAQGGQDADTDEESDDKPKKRRRRGRRGGRRNRKDGAADGDGQSADGAAEDEDPSEASPAVTAEDGPGKADEAETKTERTASPADAAAVAESYEETDPGDAQPAAPADEEQTASAATSDEAPKEPAEPANDPASTTDKPVEPEGQAADAEAAPEGPKRGGWWQRALGR